jgi:SNF2 family DNA or RNA helicase
MNYKELTKKEVDGIWEQLDEFKTVPYLHQKISILFGLNKNSVGIFSDVGVGKTLICIYLAILKDCKRVLIICPNSVKYNWLKEIQKHLDKSCMVLEGSTNEKLLKLKSDHWAHVTNYESLRWIYANGTRAISHERLQNYTDFDCIIYDEIHKVKNYKALQSRIALELSKHIPLRFAATGTPVGNGLLDLFNQMKVLDLGKTFGNVFWKYRREYFNEKTGWFASEWIPKEDAEERITDKLKDTVIRYELNEDGCLDLPERIYETREIEISGDQRKVVDAFTADLETYLQGEKIEVNGALARAMKITQVVNGFVLKDGKPIFFDTNPKLEELVDVVNEISGKVVIVHRFVAEGKFIQARLKKEGYATRALRGEIKDKNKELLEFQNDPNIKAIVINPQSGGIGIDLYQASTMIFFSNSYSYLERHQCEGRTHRSGQKNTCLYIDLLAINSLDEMVYNTLMDKKNLSDRILERIKGGV